MCYHFIKTWSILVKILFLDMDGTIIDSSVAITKTINKFRLNYGMQSTLSKEFVVKTINTLDVNPYREFYGIDNIDTKQIKEFEKEYAKNYISFAKLYPGAYEFILNCKKNRNLSVVLASNAPSSQIKNILEFFNIDFCFDLILGAGKNIINSEVVDILPKPNTHMIDYTINFFSDKNIPLNNIYLVGDSPKDRLCAENSNINFIGVNWGFGELSGCDIVHNFEQLQEKIF